MVNDGFLRFMVTSSKDGKSQISVSRHLAKVGVEGSNPFARSMFLHTTNEIIALRAKRICAFNLCRHHVATRQAISYTISRRIDGMISASQHPSFGSASCIGSSWPQTFERSGPGFCLPLDDAAKQLLATAALPQAIDRSSKKRAPRPGAALHRYGHSSALSPLRRGRAVP